MLKKIAGILTLNRAVYHTTDLETISRMPTVPRGKWMDTCWGRVCPSPVSLQASTSCRLGTDQMWLKNILQGSIVMQKEQSPLQCSLQMLQF